MGTSKGYGGPATGLVPSWVDDPVPGVGPGPAPATPGVPASPMPGTPAQGPPVAPPIAHAQADTSAARGLGGARGSFSRFARTGSRSSLGRALANYVRSGTGGAGRPVAVGVRHQVAINDQGQ